MDIGIAPFAMAGSIRPWSPAVSTTVQRPPSNLVGMTVATAFVGHLAAQRLASLTCKFSRMRRQR